ncbi:SPOR domain-containing protein [Pseudoxanthomonas sp. JBR18]|uniref:SPOR domain-containing protein n=1 Tax=Pseudoxanthomonas sp. JBR18 TaxID=2969308 RepID=UPI00230572A8|nr:SPOR domain-containing protein [Pseudoxanthomonas sp. JBR18]WCE05268.1 SPOR domain-containing protein [Pseudoxanthomonas sp. JBR18]
MLIRALIVLLVFLNLGVAGWWLSRPAQTEPPTKPPQAVAQLELVAPSAALPLPEPAIAPPTPSATETQEPVPAPSMPSPAPTTSSESVAAPPAAAPPSPAQASVPPPSPTAAEICLALGPFDSAEAARAARGRLQQAPRRAQVRSEPAPARAYSVILPPLADRSAAQAMVERIAQAGFTDYMIINTGETANGVALGRYGSREAALRRQADLRKAGFSAQLQPVGEEGASQWWLDVALPSDAGDSAAVRVQAQASRAATRDCGRISG